MAPEVEVREHDRRGPLLEGDLGRGGVPLGVVLAALGMLAGHRVPAHDLPRHERAPVERGELVALRLQEAAHVRDEAHGDERHALVGRGGECLAVDLVRVRRVVGVGVLHPLGVGGGEAHELLVTLALGVAARRAHDAHLLGAAVEGVEHLHGGDGRVVARTGGHGEDLAFPLVGQRVEDGHRPHVVVILDHVGVEDDLRRGGGNEQRGAKRRAQEQGVWSFHDSSVAYAAPLGKWPLGTKRQELWYTVRR